jgi:alpha-ribazole phosphatase
MRTFSGLTDVELSEEGKASLGKAKEFFNNKEISKIYISPLLRCKQTAQIIFGDREFIVDEGLKEINFGEWEGIHFKEVMLNYPELWEDYMENWRDFTFPGGDNIPTYQKLAARAIRVILDNHDGGDIVVVSHNGFTKAAMSYILTGDIRLAFSLSVQNGKISQIVIDDNFSKLRLLNY